MLPPEAPAALVGLGFWKMLRARELLEPLVLLKAKGFGLAAALSSANLVEGFKGEPTGVVDDLLAIFSKSDLAADAVPFCILDGWLSPSSLTDDRLLFLPRVDAGTGTGAGAGACFSWTISSGSGARRLLLLETPFISVSLVISSSALRFLGAVTLVGVGSSFSSSGSGRPCSRRHLLRTSFEGLTF